MHESYTDLFAARSSERKLAWPSVLISQNGGQDVTNHGVLCAKIGVYHKCCQIDRCTTQLFMPLVHCTCKRRHSSLLFSCRAKAPIIEGKQVAAARMIEGFLETNVSCMQDRTAVRHGGTSNTYVCG
jgi:hypothetical protein